MRSAKDALLTHRQITGPAISPDGQTVACTITSWSTSGSRFERGSHVWRGLVGKPESLTPVPAASGSRAPSWSPNGSHLAFLAPAPEFGGAPQLWAVSAVSGTPRRITSSQKGVAAYVWAPDSQRFAVTFRPTEHSRQLQSPIVWTERRRPPRLVAIVTLAGMASQVALPSDVCAVGTPAWSPSGDSLAVLCEPAEEESVALQSLWLVDEVGEPARCLARDLSDAQSPAWAPDGSAIAIVSAALPISRLPGVIVPNLAANFRILCLDPIDGRVREAPNCNEWQPVPQAPVWAPGGEALYITVGIGMHRELASYSPRLQTLTRESRDQQVTLGPVAKDGSMAFVSESVRRGPELFLWRPREPSVQRLSSFNSDAGDRVSWRILQWTSPDGVQSEGLLLEPATADGDAPPPCITIIHGGPMDAHCADFKGATSECGLLWAERGWSVFYPNPRGSTNYGINFMAAAIGDLGGGDLADVMAGVATLVSQGLADATRCVVAGWSYGAYLAAMAAVRTHAFRAAIAGGGVYDLTSMFGTSNLPGPIAGYLRALPGCAGHDQYSERSPLSVAGAAQTPLLLLHGERDSRAPVGQALEMYRVLRSHGKTAELVVYPGEGHGFGELANIQDRFERQLAWAQRFTSEVTSGAASPSAPVAP